MRDYHMSEEVLTMPEETALLLNKHDKELQTHDKILEDHELQLRVQAEQIKQLQDNAIKLENVVMAENRETRLTITQTNQKLHELINGLMGYNTGNNQMANNLKMARMESWAKIIGILAGSGGVIYFIIEQVSK
jgi:nicotinamide mononucleotide adenylyltransferase